MIPGNSTSDSGPSGSSGSTALFYNVVKSLREFDQYEVDGVVGTLLSKTNREQCFIATYYRCAGNVDTLLTLEHVRHFQAVAMLARGLFELAVDMRLLEVVPGGSDKMILFADVEKLRCAQKVVNYKNSNPSSALDSTRYATFVSTEKARIDLVRSTMWPNLKKVDHWSGQNLAQRVALIRRPFDEFYEGYYPLLSWYVHSGLTGIVNLHQEVFMTMCGIAFRLAAESYSQILLAMIREFKIAKGNEKVEEKLKAAKMLPFADSPEQADQLFREMME